MTDSTGPKVNDKTNVEGKATDKASRFGDKKLPQFEEPGLRNVKTTNIFRAVNFELYVKPVSTGKKCHREAVLFFHKISELADEANHCPGLFVQPQTISVLWCVLFFHGRTRGEWTRCTRRLNLIVCPNFPNPS